MRVFFIGTVDFSMEMFKILVQTPSIEIVGLATKSKSQFNADHKDLAPLAESCRIPFKYVKDINAEHIVDWIRTLSPDIIFCLGWSSILKEKILKLAPKGVVGYHPAKLPQNRGRHPIIWALVLGLDKTASTFFKMDGGADSGDIISQEDVTIDFEDTAASLYEKLTETAKKQLLVFISPLAEDKLSYKPQDHSNSNYWRKRGKKDGEIDFRMSSITIYNLVRALTRPYVGAHISHGQKDYKVWKASMGPKVDDNIEPGKIIAVENHQILVKTADSTIYLLEHEIDFQATVNEYFR